MMNSDHEMIVPIDTGTTEEDGAPASTNIAWEDGIGNDGRRTTTTCTFFVGFDMTRGAQPDGALELDVNEDHHPQQGQGTEEAGLGDTVVNCVCSPPLGNSDDAQDVSEPTDCNWNDEENSLNADLHAEDREDLDDPSPPKVVEVDRDMFSPADEMCFGDDDDDNVDDATEQFCDAECGDLDDETEEGAGCGDSVSDSVSFEVDTDEVDGGVGTEDLPESQSDSMLCRLPVRLDSVQELSDSASEDIVNEHSVGVDTVTVTADSLALSPSTTSPTSPSSIFDQALADHRSPDSNSKPPTGAVVLRKSASSRSDSSPQSPEYAIVQGQKVELRPSKMTSATKRVSSFRKSLIK